MDRLPPSQPRRPPRRQPARTRRAILSATARRRRAASLVGCVWRRANPAPGNPLLLERDMSDPVDINTARRQTPMFRAIEQHELRDAWAYVRPALDTMDRPDG